MTYFELIPTNSVFFIVFLIFCFTTLILWLVYFFIYGKIAFAKPKESSPAKQEGVSIVLYTTDDYESLKENLAFFVEQEYSNYEVIVVNSIADKETFSILKIYSNIYPNLKVITMQPTASDFGGRKFPLTIGIKEAKNDIVVISDISCKPASYTWLKDIVSQFENGTQIVLGYCKYEPRTGLLSKLMQYDLWDTSAQYLGWALSGAPYTGSSQNLVYRRSLFFKNKGFVSQYQLPTGDNELFINNVASSKNTKAQLLPNSFITAVPPKNFRNWKYLKKQAYYTAKYFNFADQCKTILYGLTQFLFYISVIMLLFNKFALITTASLLFIKLILQYWIFNTGMRKLQVKGLGWAVLPLEIFFMFFNTIVRIQALLARQRKWK